MTAIPDSFNYISATHISLAPGGISCAVMALISVTRKVNAPRGLNHIPDVITDTKMQQCNI